MRAYFYWYSICSLIFSYEKTSVIQALVNYGTIARSCNRLNSLSEILLYADNEILVYDKPAGLSSVPGLYDTDSLANRASKSFKIAAVDKMVVHRLDFATSGIMVLARNEYSLKVLHKQFRLKNVVNKRYCAIVSGSFKNY